MALLDDARNLMRTQRLSLSTERTYLAWIEQFIRFHRSPAGWRHPKDMGTPEVEAFLTHLAVKRHVSASTQNQALSAILYLYRNVLKIELGSLDAVRAHRSRHIPVVLSRDEVAQLLATIDALDTREPYGILARLMYGAGLRLLEACSIRVKDVDFQRNQAIRLPSAKARATRTAPSCSPVPSATTCSASSRRAPIYTSATWRAARGGFRCPMRST